MALVLKILRFLRLTLQQNTKLYQGHNADTQMPSSRAAKMLNQSPKHFVFISFLWCVATQTSGSIWQQGDPEGTYSKSYAECLYNC